MTDRTGTQGSVRILVVDDDQAVVDMASQYLEHTDSRFSVVTETSARDALDRLDDADEGFDCIVSDYKMPRMDGLEFLSVVREHCENVPFVLFTSQWEELFEESPPEGVTDLVRKDVREGPYSQLAARISTVADAEAT